MTLLRSGSPTPPGSLELGGKAAGLWTIADAGLPVPRFLALDAAPFLDHARACGALDALDRADAAALDDPEALEALAAGLRQRVERRPLDPALATTLREASRDHLGAAPVAVRSSAVGEDSAGHSFAGQHETVLHVRGGDALEAAVLRCWSSAFAARALAYRRMRGLPLDDVRMGVVIQAMVDGAVSGVMFTAHPVSGDRDTLLISAVWGLGEGLVSGALDADGYTVHRLSGEVHATVADKPRELRPDDEGGVRERAVEDARRRARCLDDTQARALADLGVALHARLGAPQDVEWTLIDGAPTLLQTRPITALPPPPAPAEASAVWDNSNIIESYTGVTSPLTFSFIQGAYDVVYRQFHQLVGVPAATIDANADLYPHILGLLRGRVYYNLINVYRLIALLPGFEFNKPLLEQMMGLNDVADYAPERPATPPARRYLVELPRLARTAVQFGYQIATVERRVPGFFARFDEVVDDHRDHDHRAMSPAEIVAAYEDLERRLLRHWKVPIVNDFAVMIFYGVLRSWTEAWGIDDSGALHHQLLCGEGGLMSTEPAKAALRIAAAVADDPPVARLFGDADADALADALRRREPPSEVWDRIDDYLERFGYRCVGELKLEERSLRDDPRPLLTGIQGYLGAPLPDPDELDRAERGKRRDAEARVADALRDRPLRRAAYRWMLGKARASVRDRENLRFCRTRIYGLARDLFRGMGWQLHRMGTLADPDDVFYLTLDELFGVVHGTAVCTDLRGLAAVRKAEFERYRGEPDPDDHLVTAGIPYRNNPLHAPAAAAEPGDGTLSGTPCSPGQVRATVRVVHDPRGEPPLRGEILVAARTDPGWVTIYPGAAGLLIERGSPLSHSAVVARELGIPAIVGIRGLLDAVEAAGGSGVELTMDGASGAVTLPPA